MHLPYKSIKTALIMLGVTLLIACQYTVFYEAESLVDSNGNEYGHLSWSVEATENSFYLPDRLTIEPGIGEVPMTGSMDVYPTETTTYTMYVEATRSDGTSWNTSKSVTVYIGARVDYSKFTDPNLRACAEETGYTHIEQFKTLTCFDKGIRSLRGLEQLTELTYLGIDYNKVTSYAALASLDKLLVVSAMDNGISDLTSFPSPDALNTLLLSNNKITDPSPLEDISSLRNLTLDHNLITSAYTLDGFTQLTSLFVHFNAIDDVAPLASLTALQALSLQSNGVSLGAGQLTALENLVALDMRGNPDVSCLQYASLYLALGAGLLTDGCKFP